MEDNRALFILTVFLALITLVSSATDPNDVNILNNLINDLENPEILRWQENGGDPCGPPLWNHIICNGNRVSQILVHNLNLKGQLPHNLNQLTMLTHLIFENNQLEGQLPSLKGLDKLQIASFGMNFFDMIPSDFLHGLKDLRVLILDENSYNPSEGWSFPNDLKNLVHLTNLSCVDCNLVGSLPDFLGDLNSLKSLKLSGNDLSGELPMSLNGIGLQILWLDDQGGHGITGSIDVVTTMDSLTSLWLHGNRFTGAIPSSIGNLTLLKDLNLKDNEFVGLVPDRLVNMNLDRLDLRYNQFMGPIPKFKAAKVKYSSNQFCQKIPGTPCSLEVMALINFLSGLNYPKRLVSSWSGNDPCAAPWFGLQCDSNQKVSVISLPRKHLTGTLSPSIANLESLTKVILYGNNLSGTIPSNWTSLKYLTWLDLHHNNISLPLPEFSSNVKLILFGNKLLVPEGLWVIYDIIPFLFAVILMALTWLLAYLFWRMERQAARFIAMAQAVEQGNVGNGIRHVDLPIVD